MVVNTKEFLDDIRTSLYKNKFMNNWFSGALIISVIIVIFCFLIMLIYNPASEDADMRDLVKMCIYQFCIAFAVVIVHDNILEKSIRIDSENKLKDGSYSSLNRQLLNTDSVNVEPVLSSYVSPSMPQVSSMQQVSSIPQVSNIPQDTSLVG